MPESHAHALPKGCRIEEYEIVRVLGAGGFGITYLAFDHKLDGPVALKEYFPHGHAARAGDRVAATSTGSRELFSWGLARFLRRARASLPRDGGAVDSPLAPSQRALRVAPLQPIDRRSVRQLVAFARSMQPGSDTCNHTADEDYAEALRAAVDASWRAGAAQRSIVMISDNPAHADRREQAIADARRFARRRGARHTVSAVLVDTSELGPAYPDTPAFMQRVAAAGGGQFVRADEHASLSVTILQALFDD